VSRVDERSAPGDVACDARREYTRRLQLRRSAVAREELWERRVADARLAVFAAGLVVLCLALWFHRLDWMWTLAPLAVYVGLVIAHDRLKRSAVRARRAVEFYERGLKRLDGTWPGTGVSGARFLSEEHPYAADLDLFGAGSLFERLCTARTRAGEETLAAWLLGPAEPGTIAGRQEAVVELRPRLDLREDLELIGAEVRAGIDPDALAAWGRAPGVFASRPMAVTGSLLAVLAMLSLAAPLLVEVGLVPLFVVIVLEVAYSLWVKGRVRRVLDPVERRTHDLVLLSELLARLERESFRSPTLARLREALQTGGEPASARIARLARLLHVLETKDNQFFAPLAALLLWTSHLARAIDTWRVHTGPAIAGWLEAAGEFEALSALASYAFENLGDPFPEVVAAPAVFDGEAVGHPLIADSTCVRNDVRLGGEDRVLLVSGSNMSGKSTLLRTVGVNAVLALAGAPVRARRLRVSMLSIGATLRVQDSLQAGRSRFYAEITRVRQLVALAEGPRPLLFLLDEIFHGTNSHDRAVGAGAVVRGLLDRGAIGLVTTHDLALAALADDLAPRAANVHFEDQLVDGTMHFDYLMRPGVVRHSNALALMRAVGLDV
jgi:hypothetical protein